MVDSKNNSALEGVNIYFKSLKASILTNTLGEFSILVPDQFPLVLNISYVGYDSQELILNASEFVTILMQEKVQS